MNDVDAKAFEAAEQLFDSGHREQAFEQLRRLIQAETDPEVRAGLLFIEADWLGAIDQLTQARRVFEAARALLPDTEHARQQIALNEADLLIGEGRYEDALKITRWLWGIYAPYENDPTYSEMCSAVRYREGVALAKLERYKEAYPLLRTYSESDLPKQSTFYFFFGLASADVGDWKNAKPSLANAIDMGIPDNCQPAAWFYLGVTEYNLEAHARALHCFRHCESQMLQGSPSDRMEILSWLEASCRSLGLEAEADCYAEKLKTHHS